MTPPLPILVGHPTPPTGSCMVANPPHHKHRPACGASDWWPKDKVQCDESPDHREITLYFLIEAMTLSPDLVLMHHPSPLGTVILAATPQGLAGLWFEGQRHLPNLTHQRVNPQHPLLREAAHQLDAYWNAQRTTFDLPLDLSSGTAFQQRVWRSLLGIRCGETRDYSALAVSIGQQSAVRAVGSAVGRNPISIVVPCHRVMGKDGSLTGYAGGLDRKRRLLALEGAF